MQVPSTKLKAGDVIRLSERNLGILEIDHEPEGHVALEVVPIVRFSNGEPTTMTIPKSTAAERVGGLRETVKYAKNLGIGDQVWFGASTATVTGTTPTFLGGEHVVVHLQKVGWEDGFSKCYTASTAFIVTSRPEGAVSAMDVEVGDSVMVGHNAIPVTYSGPLDGWQDQWVLEMGGVRPIRQEIYTGVPVILATAEIDDA